MKFRNDVTTVLVRAWKETDDTQVKSNGGQFKQGIIDKDVGKVKTTNKE